ncbi:MAG: hypothetical protein FWG52_08305 [Proteobacteria bacterium]|nr:hypothetical protein [Pseudomonadota bacterium]
MKPDKIRIAALSDESEISFARFKLDLLPEATAAAKEPPASPGEKGASEEPEEVFDEQIQAIDEETGKPVPNLAYFIESPDGNTYSGFTDTNGLCERVTTDETKALSVWFGDEAEEKKGSV